MTDRMNLSDDAIRAAIAVEPGPLVVDDVRERLRVAVPRTSQRRGAWVLLSALPSASPAVRRTMTLGVAAALLVLALALVTLAGRERDLILEHYRERTISVALVEPLLANATLLLERARGGGRTEYQRAAKQTLEFGWRFQLAQWLHRHLKIEGYLARLLAHRFEMLYTTRILIEAMIPFIDRKISPILGLRAGEILQEIIGRRREALDTALDAVRLQYPSYAEALERRLLHKAALRQEELEYDVLFGDGLIGPELHGSLRRGVDEQRKRADVRPRLDLTMNPQELVAQMPLFSGLSGDELGAVVRLLRSYFAVPGERLIRRGDRGDALYIIASGALEVVASNNKLRLGRGDFVGEIALLTGQPRATDVYAIGYCSLLRLDARAFRAFLAEHPDIRQRIEAVAAERVAANAAARALEEPTEMATREAL